MSLSSIFPEPDQLQKLNGPELWEKILKPIRSCYGHAIIAGGCVRDYLLGFPPKDFDVFVNVPTREALESRLDDLLDQGYDGGPLERLDDEDYQLDELLDVRGVLDGHLQFGQLELNVQIVARPSTPFDGATLTSKFDLGIAQAWYENGQIGRSSQFDRDVDDRSISILRTGSAALQSRDRAIRFIDKTDYQWTLRRAA